MIAKEYLEKMKMPIVCWPQLLWNTLDTDNFSFLLFNFSDFILILFSFFYCLLDNEEAHDTAVT